MGDGCFILLVEDDPDDAFFLRRALDATGFKGILRHVVSTDEARLLLSACEGTSEAERSPLPDLVIADSDVTQRGSGVDFLEWMRANPIYNQVPFIILSGDIAPATQARAKMAGAQQILLKCADSSERVNQARNILGLV